MTLALPQYSPSLLSKLFPSPLSGDEKPATPDGGIVPASKRRELPLDPLRSSKFCLNDGKLFFPLSPKDLVPLPSPRPRARFGSPAS
jgi:hypothetical protein